MDTLATRIEIILEEKKMSVTELAKKANLKAPSIFYILNNNLSKSKLTIEIAKALEVSYEYLAHGVKDDSFLHSFEIPVFNNMYVLFNYLNTKENNSKSKALTSNILCKNNCFAFSNGGKPEAIYFCRADDIKSSKYIEFDVLKNDFKILDAKKTDLAFPIVEEKVIYMKD